MSVSAPLPIDAVLPELAAALERGTRAVLVAAPGAGKTTRVPLALLDAPWRNDGKIVMLEPRRLPARAAARRMAQTLSEAVGETVGYRVRMDTKVSPRTRIEVVTEGVFSRMLIDDPELSGIAAVIFDEFHERSLDGDLGLALTLDASALREDLRILVMSATLDGARVASLLGDAPVIESAGRAFPIETRHIVPDANARIEDSVIATVLSAMREEAGSVLVFLPGQAEIRRVAERLHSQVGPDTDIAPLYGQLSGAEQDMAIQPAQTGRRKIVLATAIAQTSLTIEGIRIVIDSGLARVPVFEPETGLTRLATRRVSLAAADQRRGRAGRTEPGVCYRLWHEGQNASLEPFDAPEIFSADLTSLVLDLASWGVTDPATLSFPDQPPMVAWSKAKTALAALGALDQTGGLTALGRKLSALPLDPRLGAMLVAAADDGEAMDAALAAVVLGEPGLGGNGSDLAERVARIARQDNARAKSARALAARLARQAGGNDRIGMIDVGSHLARAYPDRIAQRVGVGRFRLAVGRQARMEETDALAQAEFLVVAEMTGSAQSGFIRQAAGISREDLHALLDDRIMGGETLQFDREAKAVRARMQTRFGALVFDDAPAQITDLEQAAHLLAQGAIEIGIDRLAWSREQMSLRGRASFLRAHIGEDWPDLSARGLSDAGPDWLAPHLYGLTRIAEITAEHLSAALFALLPWEKRQEMERLLPSHFDAPSGSRIPIDYGAENGPVLAIRVQELFGLDSHPSIANGRVKLLLSLLSPAHRPIQTTRDLPGFWRGSWRDVAKDLKGRYPKHFWPDDPIAAQATSRAKPRGQ
ncbi:ATP-dependent helicase HrpB [Pelagibacterium lentulum]|uniref:ATP-dependent helicase n=1 Tax=Pelagibacterium lentulum TaxID=2029865 RepID=A0A916W3L3_9HYPH|nr:ATP-dependent helicase HrpB [Pelagibacterium lentulum]GGA63153.1 ATP-dependent helicase [Pelagibacterium lentulum]